MVRPKLKYYSNIWDPYYQEHKNKLQSVQRRAAIFVRKDLTRHIRISDKRKDLNWKTIDDRRTIYRLTLLYKSVHNIVAVNIDENYTEYLKGNITTRKTSSTYFTYTTARYNCYRYSFMPRIVAEWNLLLATIIEAQSVDSFKAILCNIKFYTHLTKKQNCSVTSVGRKIRTPTTVYPVCADMIVVLDRNRNVRLT